MQDFSYLNNLTLTSDLIMIDHDKRNKKGIVLLFEYTRFVILIDYHNDL